MAGKVWTEQERNFMRKNFVDMSCKEMAKFLPGRTPKAVQREFNNMKLKRPQPKIGDKFNRLTIINIYEKRGKKQIYTMCDVQCTCGKIKKSIRLTIVKKEIVKSCDCLKREKAAERCAVLSKTHGLTKHPIYSIYCGMIYRCKNKKFRQWKDYGGRGITVCDEWKNNFMTFYNWSLSNGWCEGLQIDRIDVDGNYEPQNCRWATVEMQQNNKRTSIFLEIFGERKTVGMWSKDSRCVVSQQALWERLFKLGWTPIEALTTPIGLQGTRY